MTWRTVVISNRAKLECNLGSMVVRNRDGFKKIPINELAVVLVESTAVSITAALLAELGRNKVKVIFCDERRNPSSELVSYYGAFDCSLRIRKQIAWNEIIKQTVWTCIVTEKIKKQRDLLRDVDCPEAALLNDYLSQIEFNDASNREGHAAKVYFNALFGKCFSRDAANSVNAALNYGYAVILSAFNREITAAGYLTQIGIAHCNQFNFFNLSCDLMEPFRPLVDRCVLGMDLEEFGKKEKMQLVDILNQKVLVDGRRHTVLNAIKLYTGSIFKAIEERKPGKIKFYRNEL